jgi:integrase
MPLNSLECHRGQPLTGHSRTRPKRSNVSFVGLSAQRQRYVGEHNLGGLTATGFCCDLWQITVANVSQGKITKFQVQMLLNRLAAEEYSYTVVYHARDLIKAALAEALDQEVLERNVARKTVIPEIEESDKPVLPVEMYAKLLAGLDGIRDRAIFLIACFCALRPSELFGLTWGCYTGNVFTIVNTAWRGRLQRKKIKRKNRYGRTNYRFVAIPQAVRKAIDLWRAKCPNPDANALMFPGMQARARKPLASPIHPDNWLRLRLYPVANKLGIAFHPTFQVLRRSFSTHGRRKHTRPRCRPNSDTAIFVPPWTSIRRLQTRKWPGW